MLWRRRLRVDELEEVRAAPLLAGERRAARPARPVADCWGVLGDPRLGHRANTAMRARALSALQHHCGNACLQRALAAGRRQEAAAADSFGWTPTAQGAQLSFRLNALLDSGRPAGGAGGGTPEREQPIEESLEPVVLTLNTLEDAITRGTISFGPDRTARGGLDTEGGFGKVEPTLRPDIRVVPHERWMGLLEGSFEVSIQATIDFRYEINSLNRTDILNENAAPVNAATWDGIAADLTPEDGAIPRSPRDHYWCSDLTVRHELFHRDDYSQAFRRLKSPVEAWLRRQTARSANGARTACREAVQMLTRNVLEYMGEGDFAPCEARAYTDGAPAYRARAEAIRARAQREGWSAPTAAPAAAAPRRRRRGRQRRGDRRSG